MLMQCHLAVQVFSCMAAAGVSGLHLLRNHLVHFLLFVYRFGYGLGDVFRLGGFAGAGILVSVLGDQRVYLLFRVGCIRVIYFIQSLSACVTYQLDSGFLLYVFGSGLNLFFHLHMFIHGLVFCFPFVGMLLAIDAKGILIPCSCRLWSPCALLLSVQSPNCQRILGASLRSFVGILGWLGLSLQRLVLNNCLVSVYFVLALLCFNNLVFAFLGVCLLVLFGLFYLLDILPALRVGLQCDLVLLCVLGLLPFHRNGGALHRHGCDCRLRRLLCLWCCVGIHWVHWHECECYGKGDHQGDGFIS